MSRRRLLTHALAMGAVLGVAKIVALEIGHVAFGVPALVSPVTGIILWVVAIGAMVLAAWRLKVSAGDYQPLTTVIFHLCLVWATGQLLFVGWSILLFHVISPDLLDATVEPMRVIARKLGERAALPADQLEAHVASISAASSPFSVAGQLRGYRDGLFPGIVLAAIVAFPFRARPPAAAVPA